MQQYEQEFTIDLIIITNNTNAQVLEHLFLKEETKLQHRISQQCLEIVCMEDNEELRSVNGTTWN